MFRNGVVSHSTAWWHGGYTDVQSPPERCRLIRREARTERCGVTSHTEPDTRRREWFAETLMLGAQKGVGVGPASAIGGPEPLALAHTCAAASGVQHHR